jgi:hypothetical protein
MPGFSVKASAVREILAAVGSRKRTAYIYPTTEVTYSGTFWDGGSRTVYTAVELATGRAVTGVRFDPPQFGGPRVDPVVQIPRGVVIVEHGTFMGKPATPRIHVHPEDMPRYLPNQIA